MFPDIEKNGSLPIRPHGPRSGRQRHHEIVLSETALGGDRFLTKNSIRI